MDCFMFWPWSITALDEHAEETEGHENFELVLDSESVANRNKIKHFGGSRRWGKRRKRMGVSQRTRIIFENDFVEEASGVTEEREDVMTRKANESSLRTKELTKKWNLGLGSACKKLLISNDHITKRENLHQDMDNDVTRDDEKTKDTSIERMKNTPKEITSKQECDSDAASHDGFTPATRKETHVKHQTIVRQDAAEATGNRKEHMATGANETELKTKEPKERNKVASIVANQKKPVTIGQVVQKEIQKEKSETSREETESTNVIHNSKQVKKKLNEPSRMWEQESISADNSNAFDADQAINRTHNRRTSATVKPSRRGSYTTSDFYAKKLIQKKARRHTGRDTTASKSSRGQSLHLVLSSENGFKETIKSNSSVHSKSGDALLSDGSTDYKKGAAIPLDGLTGTSRISDIPDARHHLKAPVAGLASSMDESHVTRITVSNKEVTKSSSSVGGGKSSNAMLSGKDVLPSKASNGHEYKEWSSEVDQPAGIRFGTSSMRTEPMESNHRKVAKGRTVANTASPKGFDELCDCMEKLESVPREKKLTFKDSKAPKGFEVGEDTFDANSVVTMTTYGDQTVGTMNTYYTANTIDTEVVSITDLKEKGFGALESLYRKSLWALCDMVDPNADPC